MAGKTATKTPPGVGKNDVKIFYTCFVICAILVGTFFYFAPPADFYECKGVNLGWVIANAKDPATHKTLYDCASVYRQGNESTLLIGFVLLYVLFQVFAIPGPPLVLSILSGALYPYFFAHGLVAISATCGATISSLISRVLGNGLLSAWGLQSKLEVFRKEVDKNKNMLFRYMVLSRVTPIPNVVINLGSPLVGVPTHTFFFSTLIGLVPLNAVHISTGYALANGGDIDKRIPMVIFCIGSVAGGIMFYNDRKKKAAAGAKKKK